MLARHPRHVPKLLCLRSQDQLRNLQQTAGTGGAATKESARTLQPWEQRRCPRSVARSYSHQSRLPQPPHAFPASAKSWASTFDRATRPYQFALQARACTDALAAHVRVALDQDPNQVLVSLDGRSAYDSISRTLFLTALKSVAPELLPSVRLLYGRPSTYCLWDASGHCRDVAQGEGCEQGDPLAPALLFFFFFSGSFCPTCRFMPSLVLAPLLRCTPGP